MAKGDHLGELEVVTLLAVARLGNEADGATVHREIVEVGDRRISQATVYVTLARLRRKRYLRSAAGLRGGGPDGRPRRLYQVTLEGVVELQAIRLTHERLWQGVPFDPLREPL